MHQGKSIGIACLPVLRSGKSGSYFDIVGGGCWGILYGWELGTQPAGNDSPDELLTTPLENRNNQDKTV